MVEHVGFRDLKIDDITGIEFGEPGSLAGWLDDPSANVMVATWRGRVVGYAVSWLAAVHRTRRFIDVEVAPESRGRRIGSRLVERVKERSDRPLATKTVEGSDAEGFIRSLGGVPYAICPPLELPRRQFGRVVAMLGGHRDVVPVSTLPPGEAEHLWAQIYRWVHQDWSPVDDSEKAREVLRSEASELDLDHTAIALVDGQPAAVAFVFDDEGAPTVCAETVTPDAPDGDQALAAAVGRVVADARDRGCRRLQFDGHEADPHFGPLAHRLPLEGSRLLLLEI
ncbi:GNAT family N-acetyltransferase [Acidipropionibacterium jensenii]|uniref:GNAT family N-acetyltransferase n=1 Tax=Acidipropionibacterium jensenii TaxID=1749 RepID=UPI002647B756|nr:GNAT family N-acetyltransferase [Acidipropionibacterium jensenii]MDN5977629.1 GNAT family N-acetyltransferase [Acidipropionibacterium jensenii]MDN6427046.1 GNAT family N-acetyltransferase [Acidipropionibacterium jensenii]MDN6441572.1 GNAT family N-acetyltransferase [Acidipropionibacterium jensenii]MDN6481257.1 GNAT family N-acetyltransferase [Acidipropionibacterium jensenii]MDN6514078.1 GNAT family N-acetyltransferase [Acidipropionibacterium jensenii]